MYQNETFMLIMNLHRSKFLDLFYENQKREFMDKKDLIGTPSMHFKSVEELVKSPALNNDEKLTALYNWKDMSELQKTSTAEGMGGERTTPIAEILKAIRDLEK